MIALGLKWWWSFGSYSDYVFTNFFLLLFIFWLFHVSFTWRLLKIIIIIIKSSFIPFPLQTLTSEESTLEFYDINDTSFLKELDDFSDELFICHKPYMFINTRENTIGFMMRIIRYFVSLLRKGVWQLRWWAPSRISLFEIFFSIFFLRFFFNREGGKWVFMSLDFVLVGNTYFCWIKFENLGIKTWPGSRWIDNWRVLMLVSLGTDIILLV